MDKSIKKIKIAASLSYGRIWTVPLIIVWICWVIIGFVGLFVAFKSFILGDVWFEITLCVLGSCGFIGSGSYLIVKDIIIRKKIYLWKKDAIKLNAYSSKIDARIAPPTFNFRDIKIKVSFFYQKKIERVSGRKNKEIYDPIFYRYSNREIQILYSPKYDEIMIIKD